MENKICVYAICKNESKFVDAWYESMKEADAIVVLDTGSTDDTVEKLRSHGITVGIKEIKPWRFDVARNESLKLVPEDCNILVCTDLDEVLEPGWSKPLREQWVEGKHTRAEYLYVWSHLEDGSNGRVFRYNKVHDRTWKWIFPVHECLVREVDDPVKPYSENYSWDNTLDLYDKMILHHYPDVTKPRSSYLPLLELRAKEYPVDTYGLIYLMHEYHYRGMEDKSIALATKIIAEHKDELGSLEVASCYLFIGDCYEAKGETVEAIKSYLSAISIDKTYREPYLQVAKCYLELDSYDLAIAYIKDGLKNSYRHYTWLERDTSWSYEPYDLLSLAYYYSGDKIRSLGCAQMAVAKNGLLDRLHNNVDIIVNNIEDKDCIS